MSMRVMVCRLLPLAALGLFALPAAAQKVACFVVPLQGAKASDASGRIDAPRLAADCASVAVQEGKVRVIFATKSDGASVNVLAAGEKLALADASPRPQGYKAVGEEILSVTRRTGEAPPGKAFDATGAGAEAQGGPYQDVYIPPAGLRLVVAPVNPATDFRVLDKAGGKPVQQGSANGSVLLTRKGLVPGAEYLFVLVHAGKEGKPSKFTLVDAALDKSVAERLASIDAAADMDKVSRAIARALVYEAQSLSFNRTLAMREAQQ